MTQPRLKDSTIIHMINESRRIQRAVIVWLIILVISIFVLINPATVDNAVMFGGSIAAIIVSIAAIVLSALRVRGIGNQQPPAPPTVTYEDANDASDVLNFPQQHEGRATGLQNRQGNTITIGYLRLYRRQWRALVAVLADNRVGNVVGWSRRKMEKHNMPEIDGTDWEAFTGLTARNELGETKFAALTKELQSLDIVNKKGNQVTNDGWEELCMAAGLNVVI